VVGTFLCGLMMTVTGDASAQTREPHPLFPMMEGYRVESREDRPFDAYKFRLAPDKTETVEGRYISVSYLRDSALPSQSSVAVARNHETAIRQMGGEMIGRIGTATNPAYLTFRVRRGGETI
jgi:hypothetical protein